MRRLPLLLVALLAVVAVAVVTVVVVLGRDGWEEPEPARAIDAGDLSRFYEQALSWKKCGDARCTWVEVPIDYEEPAGATTRVRVAVHPAEGTSRRSLFVNPGGPGGSALEYADMMTSALGDDVREIYDVVGVDPRGVGKSSPVECLSTKQFDDYVASDPTPDDASEVEVFVDTITEFGAACEEKVGDLAGHVSTEEAARDMDVVRSLLGRARLDWFGASYGTQLGATYAQLFPDHVGRMVLDGAVDSSLSSIEANLRQVQGFQRALESYVDWCVRQDGCPLGTDPDVGLQRIADLMESLDADPLQADGRRVVTQSYAFYGIAAPLYNERNWPTLNEALKQAFAGQGYGLMVLSDLYFDRKPYGQADGKYATNLGQVNVAVNCLDARDRPTLDEAKARIPEFERASPVFGATAAWGLSGCSMWPFPAEHPQIEITGKGAPPIVVVGTTNDPATPYESAEALASQLESAVLLTREGDGHTAYSSGNSCIVKAVDRYLVDGTPPKDGTVCEDE